MSEDNSMTDRLFEIQATGALTLEPPANAYDLLERVLEIENEEPRRYQQSHWGAQNGHYQHACKTTGCNAGWMVVAAYGFEVFEGALARGDIEEIAIHSLLGHRVYNDNVFGSAIDNIFKGDNRSTAENTRMVRAFMAEFEDRLRAHKIEPLPSNHLQALRNAMFEDRWSKRASNARAAAREATGEADPDAEFPEDLYIDRDGD